MTWRTACARVCCRSDEIEDQPLAGKILRSIRKEFPAIETFRVTHELIRRVISVMIYDVMAESARAVAVEKVASADDARGAGKTLVAFSAKLSGQERVLKAFLQENLYHHPLRMPSVEDAEALVIQLFEAFHTKPGLMPDIVGARTGSVRRFQACASRGGLHCRHDRPLCACRVSAGIRR